jgi:hypothetical protein
MSQLEWFAVVFGLSAAVIALDVATGPYLYFPILFVFPVGLAAWFLGRNEALWTAVAVVAARFWVAVTYDTQYMPLWAAVMNAGIRLIAFCGLAYLLSRIAEYEHELEHRIEELEGILPICSFCKKIRNDEGSWEQLERYVTDRSAAEFSHSICGECERQHYGEHAH